MTRYGQILPRLCPARLSTLVRVRFVSSLPGSAKTVHFDVVLDSPEAGDDLYVGAGGVQERRGSRDRDRVEGVPGYPVGRRLREHVQARVCL